MTHFPWPAVLTMVVLLLVLLGIAYWLAWGGAFWDKDKLKEIAAEQNVTA